MFITYLLRELRRRMRQAIFVGAGLALGIGLVITVIAASTGVSDSQGAVLHSLYGVGTDVSVTQAPVAGSGRPSDFRVGGTQGKAGTTFSRDILLGAGLGTLKSSDVTTISGLKDVSATSGALSLTDLSLSGTVQSGSQRSEEHTSELQSRGHLVCRLLLEKKKKNKIQPQLIKKQKKKKKK